MSQCGSSGTLSSTTCCSSIRDSWREKMLALRYSRVVAGSAGALFLRPALDGGEIFLTFSREKPEACGMKTCNTNTKRWWSSSFHMRTGSEFKIKGEGKGFELQSRHTKETLVLHERRPCTGLDYLFKEWNALCHAVIGNQSDKIEVRWSGENSVSYCVSVISQHFVLYR